MDNKLSIYVGDRLAGYLIKESELYAFEYLQGYDGPTVFLGWELDLQRREWREFPPAFDGLLPEGVLLDQLLAKHKLDKADKWNQLRVVGRDLSGFISVLSMEDNEGPIGRWIPVQKPRRRVAIDPPESALPYTSTELVAYHGKHKLRMSLSGVQPKVSAVFSRKENCFKIVETNGSYILKPSPQAFPGASENEVLTMKLAKEAGLDIPLCGWLRAKDGSGVFWIERFDRWGVGNRNRVRCEDFCQILEVQASWKYLGNLETLARVVREHCSNPRLQLVLLFHRVLFCWITGNGDMHLKNWSLIENGSLIELAPAYDLLNTHVLIDDEEESALALDDCKSGWDRGLLVDYFGKKICSVSDRMIAKILNQLRSVDWERSIYQSALDEDARQQYVALVRKRLGILFG